MVDNTPRGFRLGIWCHFRSGECIDENAGKAIRTQSQVKEMKLNTIAQKEKELRTLRHMRMKDFISDDEFVEEKSRIDKDIELLNEQEVGNKGFNDRKEKLKHNLIFLSEAKMKLLEGDNQMKTNILRDFGDEHSIVEGNLVLRTYDWMQPFLTSYKSLENRYDRLGMENNQLNQGGNGDLATIRSSWCG